MSPQSLAPDNCVRFAQLLRARGLMSGGRMRRVTSLLLALLLCLRKYRKGNRVISAHIPAACTRRERLASLLLLPVSVSLSVCLSIYLSVCLFAGVNHAEGRADRSFRGGAFLFLPHSHPLFLPLSSLSLSEIPRRSRDSGSLRPVAVRSLFLPLPPSFFSTLDDAITAN